MSQIFIKDIKISALKESLQLHEITQVLSPSLSIHHIACTNNEYEYVHSSLMHDQKNRNITILRLTDLIKQIKLAQLMLTNLKLQWILMRDNGI